MMDETVTPEPLTEEEIEALWRRAWLMARRCCRGTLVRLNRGRGGLYQTGDFTQDAYLAFRALARRWAAQQPRVPESELWSAWRRCLWHGGHPILRRPPQRLWRTRTLIEVDLEAIVDDVGACDDLALVRAVTEQLVDREDPETILEQAEEADGRLAMLEAALVALPQAQRILVEQVVLDGRPLEEVAASLGISRMALHSRLARALAALRRTARLDGEGAVER